MNEKISFQVIYDGEALKSNEMNVKDLAPALLGLSDLLEETNQVINGSEAQIQLNVKGTFKTGSFHIDFNVVQNIFGQITNLFNDPHIAGSAILLGLLGINAKEVSMGLIHFIKWLRGRKIKKITKTGKNKIVITVEDESIEIDERVLSLFKNIRIRKSFDISITKPLEKEGIDTFKTKYQDNEVIIKKEEREYFKEPEIEDEIIDNQKITKHLQLLTITFVEGNKWKFNDGVSTFSAEIKDLDFLRRVQDGQENFAIDDIFQVELNQKQILTLSGIKSEIEILKVISHRGKNRQITIPLESNDNANKK